MNVSHLKHCGVWGLVNNLAAPLDVLEKPEFTDYRGVGMVPTTVFTCRAISYNTKVLGMRSGVEGKTQVLGDVGQEDGHFWLINHTNLK